MCLLSEKDRKQLSFEGSKTAEGQVGRVAPRAPLKSRGRFATFAAPERALPAAVSRNADI
jgi:hypothetical protein